MLRSLIFSGKLNNLGEKMKNKGWKMREHPKSRELFDSGWRKRGRIRKRKNKT
jgi:hypothetical protein